jgi:hypothetical protein
MDLKRELRNRLWWDASYVVRGTCCVNSKLTSWTMEHAPRNTQDVPLTTKIDIAPDAITLSADQNEELFPIAAVVL